MVSIRDCQFARDSKNIQSCVMVCGENVGRLIATTHHNRDVVVTAVLTTWITIKICDNLVMASLKQGII